MLRGRYRFVYGTDSKYGRKGLKLNGSGLHYGSKHLVSHDIFEHFKRDGTLEDEYRAFGAIIWLRGEPGYFRDWESHISRSIVDMWRHLYIRQKSLPYIAPRRFGAIDPDLDYLMNRAKEVAEKALEQDADGTKMFAHFKKNLPRIRNLIRSGYREARQKYGHIGQCQMNNLYDEVSRVADQAERACEFEGQEVDIIINWKSLTVGYQVLP
jgi:hypothetical protein